MLQQTVIKAVIPVYERFIKQFPDVAALAQASSDEVRQQVRGLGYYRRFGFLHQAAAIIATRRMQMPRTLEGWRELPGIGEYTAAAIASIAQDIPAAVVDGNVERVFCRLLDLRLPPNLPALKRQFKALAALLLEPGHPGDFNQALMELGQVVCTPVAPDCVACPLASGCLSRQRGSQKLAPAAKFKRPTSAVVLNLVVYSRGARVALVERNEHSKFLKGTWGFATSEGINLTPHRSWVRCGSIAHHITHHKITAQVWLGGDASVPPHVRWIPIKDVEKNLISNLDRKAWNKFLSWKRKERES